MCCRKIVVSVFFSLSALIFISVAGVGAAAHNNGGDVLVVQGVGYPPIKASSPAQARLMARRAAVLDAYRNALAAKGVKDYDENEFFVELKGFVKGMTVLQEEYMDDGGIRLRAEVPSKDITVSSGTPHRKARQTGGPSGVTLDEWYGIINKHVTIGK